MSDSGDALVEESNEVSMLLDCDEMTDAGDASLIEQDAVVYQCGGCDLQFEDLAAIETHLNTGCGATLEEDASVSRGDLSDPIELCVTAQGNDDEVVIFADPAVTLTTETSTCSFECPICQFEFSTIDDLRRHRSEAHPEIELKNGPMFVCDICNLKFVNPSNYVRHLADEHARKAQHCPICGKYYTTKSNLKAHMMLHTGVRPHKCPVCDKTFSVHSNMKAHMRIHTGERKFACKICSKAFTTLTHLKTHQIVHTGVRQYRCEVCNREFNVASNLRSHMKTHTGEKDHMCPICGKEFMTRTHVATHMRVHTGEKPHECDICFRKFSVISNLRAHKKIHAGQRDHECDICGKRFYTSTDVRSHRLIHTGERPYACDICGERFTKSSNVASHRLTHSGARPYKCFICNKEYRKAATLRAHLRIMHNVQDAGEVTRMAGVAPAATEGGESQPGGSGGEEELNAQEDFIEGTLEALDETEDTVDDDDIESTSTVVGSVLVTSKTSSSKNATSLKPQVMLRSPVKVSPGAVLNIAAKTASVQPVKTSGAAVVAATKVTQMPYIMTAVGNYSPTVKEATKERDILMHGCEMCLRRFRTITEYNAHMKREHSTTGTLHCSYCDKKFDADWKLKAHEKAYHTDSFPHSCTHCSRRFSSLVLLDRHVASGTCQQTVCTVCNLRCLNRAHFLSHMTTHSDDDRPFACEHCNKRFHKEASLNRHVQQLHSVIRYECGLCFKHYLTEDNLVDHVKDVHNGEGLEDNPKTLYINIRAEDQNELEDSEEPQVEQSVEAAVAAAVGEQLDDDSQSESRTQVSLDEMDQSAAGISVGVVDADESESAQQETFILVPDMVESSS